MGLLKRTGWEVADRIHLAQEVSNINFRFYEMVGIP
jgi:hypothetical protein